MYAFYTVMAKRTRETRTYFALIIFIPFHCFVAETNITFERDPPNYIVFEGNPVFLVCEVEINDPVVINHDGIAIVEDSTLRGSSSKYTFLRHTRNNEYILKINRVERSDSGIYVCRGGILIVKQLNLEVYYHPSSAPLCTSSHDASKYFFEDMLNKEFEFNCTVEDGNPQSEVLIFQEFGKRERMALNAIVVNKNEGINPRRMVTFSSKLNVSFNNSSFICDVRQEIPPDLEVNDYRRVCFYGPMTFISNFQTFVSPRNLTIKEGDSKILFCYSNVQSADKKWMTNVTEGVEMEMIERGKETSLTLSVVEGFEYEIITLVCESSFENRYSSATVQIHITREKSKNCSAVLVPLIVILFILMMVVVIFAFREICSKFVTKSSFGREDHDLRIEETVDDTAGKLMKNETKVL